MNAFPTNKVIHEHLLSSLEHLNFQWSKSRVCTRGEAREWPSPPAGSSPSCPPACMWPPPTPPLHPLSSHPWPKPYTHCQCGPNGRLELGQGLNSFWNQVPVPQDVIWKRGRPWAPAGCILWAHGLLTCGEQPSWNTETGSFKAWEPRPGSLLPGTWE